MLSRSSNFLIAIILLGCAGSSPASVTGSTGSDATLSEKLEATEGVIRPPPNIAPDMTVPAPDPNPGTTPVIPPPGSPGGNQAIQPK